jgi:TetR/AcrR family transcriptional regulator, transcriptional repressor for nem operon
MPRHTDSRQRLLEIATDLIWESSYGRASVDRICERAEIRKGSFYHHFESKEQLALEALEHQWQIYRRELNEIFSPLVPPIERLRRHIAEALETQESMRDKVGFVCGCPLFSLGCEIGTLEPAIRAKIHEILDQNLRYLEAAIRDAHAAGEIVAPDPARKARILFDYCEGAHTRARIMNDLQPIREIEQNVMEILGIERTAKLSARG